MLPQNAASSRWEQRASPLFLLTDTTLRLARFQQMNLPGRIAAVA
jgi:hypothetical protein